jgi:hypothetical protein
LRPLARDLLAHSPALLGEREDVGSVVRHGMSLGRRCPAAVRPPGAVAPASWLSTRVNLCLWKATSWEESRRLGPGRALGAGTISIDVDLLVNR